MSTVLITGANRGIGLALAGLYAQRGDAVLACCRAPESAADLRALGDRGKVSVLPLDVTDEASVRALAEHVGSSAIDTLINNAGVGGGPVAEQTAANMNFVAWAHTLDVNTLGPARVLQALLPALKRGSAPKAVSITSQLGALSLDTPFALAYSSSKAALNKFMRLAAIQLKPEGVAVAVIHPGWVKTDMGGPRAEITPEESVAGIAQVIDRLSLANTGSFFKWNGGRHEW